MNRIILVIAFSFFIQLAVSQTIPADSVIRRVRKTSWGVVTSGGLNRYSASESPAKLSSKFSHAYAFGIFMDRKVAKHWGVNLQLRYAARTGKFELESASAAKVTYQIGQPFCLEAALRLQYTFFTKTQKQLFTIGAGYTLGTGKLSTQGEVIRTNDGDVILYYHRKKLINGYIPVVISREIISGRKRSVSLFIECDFDLNLDIKETSIQTPGEPLRQPIYLPYTTYSLGLAIKLL